MLRSRLFTLVLTLFIIVPLAAVPLHAVTPPPVITLQPFISGLSSPIDFQPSKDGTGRLFVVEQGGTIRIIKGGKLLAKPFLNISGQIATGGELGLLGLAFHPSYKTNGRFFVNYTRRLTSGAIQTVIAEYHPSAANRDIADPTGSIILTVNQPFENHKGGQLVFGPDGYLYIALGDGGDVGDPMRNGQNLGTLLGKILRIDVNSGAPYAIPPDNPFVTRAGAKPEIWAYGFRNPWRFSFDNQKKRLFVGDVGQDSYEEIDIAAAGGNFGWNVMEGKHCYPPGSTCNQSGKTLPIFEISHPTSACIIGGYLYRGGAIPLLRGYYVFGDFITGKIWGLKEMSVNNWQVVDLLSTGRGISAFGRDGSGNLYVLDYLNGSIFKIVIG